MPLDIFKFLRGVFRRSPEISGSIRPITYSSVGTYQERVLEIKEIPVRDYWYARQLIEIAEHCQEAIQIVDAFVENSFSSPNGDDVGFTVAETLDDNVTKVDPTVKAIALEVIQRKESFSDHVIGGTKLELAGKRALFYGDAFLSLGIDKDGLGGFAVTKSIYLPTWEVFKYIDDQGNLIGYLQSRSVPTSSDCQTMANLGAKGNYGSDKIFINPPNMVHVKRQGMGTVYGQSIYKYNVVHTLEEGVSALNQAAKELGYSPNLHIFPEDMDQEQKKVYKEDYELRKKGKDIISDLYLNYGMDVRKLANQSSLQDLIEYYRECRYRMIPFGFPTYLVPGLQFAGGSKDLSSKPAEAYARLIYRVRQMLTVGIKQVIDTEIILKMGPDWYLQNAMNKYRIIWPSWSTDGMESEADQMGIDDMDVEETPTNGNGKVKQLLSIF